MWFIIAVIGVILDAIWWSYKGRIYAQARIKHLKHKPFLPLFLIGAFGFLLMGAYQGWWNDDLYDENTIHYFLSLGGITLGAISGGHALWLLVTWIGDIIARHAERKTKI